MISSLNLRCTGVVSGSYASSLGELSTKAAAVFGVCY